MRHIDRTNSASPPLSGQNGHAPAQASASAQVPCAHAPGSTASPEKPDAAKQAARKRRRAKSRPGGPRLAGWLLRFFAVGLPAACLFSAHPFLVARAGLSHFAAALPAALLLSVLRAGDDLPQALGASLLLLPPAFMWGCQTYSLQTALLVAAGAAALGSGLAHGLRTCLRRREDRRFAEKSSADAAAARDAAQFAAHRPAPRLPRCTPVPSRRAQTAGPFAPTSPAAAAQGGAMPCPQSAAKASPRTCPCAPDAARTLPDGTAPKGPGTPDAAHPSADNAVARALRAVCLCLAAALGVGGLPICLSPDAPGAAAFLLPQALGAGLLLGAGMRRARETAARRHTSAQFATHPKAHRFSGVARRRIPAQPAPHSNACHCSHATRQRNSMQLPAHPAACLCGGAALLGGLLACLAAWGQLSAHFADWAGLLCGILGGVSFGAACALLCRMMREETPALRGLCRVSMLLGGALPGLFRDTGHSFAAPVGAVLFALLALGLCAPPNAGD